MNKKKTFKVCIASKKESFRVQRIMMALGFKWKSGDRSPLHYRQATYLVFAPRSLRISYMEVDRLPKSPEATIECIDEWEASHGVL